MGAVGFFFFLGGWGAVVLGLNFETKGEMCLLTFE